MRWNYIIDDVVDYLDGSGVDELIGDRCGFNDDNTLFNGNELKIKRKYKHDFNGGKITNVTRDGRYTYVTTSIAMFKFKRYDKDVKQPKKNEDVVNAVTSGLSIKINIDTTELDEAIKKAEHLIKLMEKVNR